MSDRRRVSAEDREFLRLVADATFSNPFGDERAAIDRRIIGATASISQEERLRRLQEVVSRRVEKLCGAGTPRLGECSDEDRELLRPCFLFETYYRFHDDFDRLILEQLEAGDQPARVPFAREALALLEARGFPRDEALRFFAILFQVRRAYYFIHTALIGGSRCMKELRRQLWNSVFTHDLRWYEEYLLGRMEDFSTLILGETGTGKGTAAAAIGRSGFIPFDPRGQRFVESFTRTFISINLSQHPEMLIESELFGHRKGSFTGAIDDHEGLLARCSPHGAVLLDEIGEVSVPVQIKLLQVLQERVFLPVGGHEKQRFQGRVIAATNCPLDELCDRRFRDDFFYRLCTNIITVPPLRQRLREDPAELDDLLRHTLARLTGEADSGLVGMVREIIDEQLPRDYAWVGNVREFEQCVRRILLTRRYAPVERTQDGRRRLADAVDAGSLSAQELVARYCVFLYERHGTLAEVARRTGLDRRTVKKHIDGLEEGLPGPEEAPR